MELTIKLYPHPDLREKAKPVEHVDKATKTLITDMLTTMYIKHGVGLAAPQVGVMQRIIVLDDQSGEDSPASALVFINPVITKRFGGTATVTEGCLSFPGEQGPVKRAHEIGLHAFEFDGGEINRTFTGLQARVIQHECDHLDGILFLDRCPKLKAEICNL